MKTFIIVYLTVGILRLISFIFETIRDYYWSKKFEIDYKDYESTWNLKRVVLDALYKSVLWPISYTYRIKYCIDWIKKLKEHIKEFS